MQNARVLWSSFGRQWLRLKTQVQLVARRTHQRVSQSASAHTVWRTFLRLVYAGCKGSMVVAWEKWLRLQMQVQLVPR